MKFEPRSLKEHRGVLTTNIRLEELETSVFSPRKAFSRATMDEWRKI